MRHRSVASGVLAVCVVWVTSGAGPARAQVAPPPSPPASIAAPAPAPAATQAMPRPAPRAPRAVGPTAQQQAQLARQDAQMTQAAQQVMQMVDAGHIGELWDSASQAMKRAVTREGFVDQVTAERVRLGTPDDRGPATVTRSQFAQGAKAPAGLYLNIAVPTQFSREASPIRELVSFRLDEDGTWRVSGYSLR